MEAARPGHERAAPAVPLGDALKDAGGKPRAEGARPGKQHGPMQCHGLCKVQALTRSQYKVCTQYEVCEACTALTHLKIGD